MHWCTILNTSRSNGRDIHLIVVTLKSLFSCKIQIYYRIEMFIRATKLQANNIVYVYDINKQNNRAQSQTHTYSQ